MGTVTTTACTPRDPLKACPTESALRPSEADKTTHTGPSTTAFTVGDSSYKTTATSGIQMPDWHLPPYNIHFNSTAPVTPSLMSAFPYITSSDYSNGWTDDQGNLLFYIADGEVYNAAGDPLGLISGAETREVVIVPFPDNDCVQQKFYLFASQSLTTAGNNVYYSILDMKANGGKGAIASNEQDVLLQYFSGGAQTGFALRQPSPDTYFLYLVGGYGGGGGVFGYTISASGISAPTTIVDLSTLTYLSYDGFKRHSEVELSHDGKMLAWSSTDPFASSYITILSLDANGNYAGSYKALKDIPSAGLNYQGLEFSADGQSLFLSASNGGIYKYDLNTDTATLVPGSSDYGSELELGRDGLIYATNGSSSSGISLQGIDPVTAQFVSASLVKLPELTKHDKLPDQIDGYDYSFLLNHVSADAGADQCLVTPGQSTTIGTSAINSAWTYAWTGSDGGGSIANPSEAQPTVTPTQATNYQVTVTTSHGCQATDFVNVQVGPPCCEKSQAFDASSYKVTTDATWTHASNPIKTGGSVMTIEKELRIPSGVHLILQEMTFEFATGAGVIVEDGASLELRGTVFQGLSSCQSMWKGVQVWGSDGAKDPGKLVLRVAGTSSDTKSVIANAQVGVLLSKENTLSATKGGVVDTEGSVFRDNYRAIVMTTSLNPNESIISINQFKTSSSGLRYPFLGKRANRFITLGMVDVKNPITQNTFDSAEEGIWTRASNFEIVGNSFLNIKVGIHSDNNMVGAFQGSSEVVSANTFQDVHTGIYVEQATPNMKITGNQFNPLGNLSSTNFYGIRIDNASGISITGNTFNKNRYGIYDVNGKKGEIGNSAEGNHFVSNWRGIHTEGDNKKLSVDCNHFTNIGLDDSTYSVFWYNGGNLPAQGGFVFGPRGNVFDDQANLNKEDIISANPFTYFYNPNYTSVTTSGVKLFPSGKTPHCQ